MDKGKGISIVEMKFSCNMQVLSQVVGPVLDTIHDVSLDDCVKLCGSKSACAFFNFFYSKISSDSWSKCTLIYTTRASDVTFVNADYVLRSIQNQLDLEILCSLLVENRVRRSLPWPTLVQISLWSQLSRTLLCSETL